MVGVAHHHHARTGAAAQDGVAQQCAHKGLTSARRALDEGDVRGEAEAQGGCLTGVQGGWGRGQGLGGRQTLVGCQSQRYLVKSVGNVPGRG